MRRTIVAASICLSMLGPCFAQTATAMTRIETRIPPEPLGQALKQFAKIYHLQVLYFTGAVRDLRSHGASGELTADETLTRLLTGTGLKYRYVDGNAVSIFPTKSDASQEHHNRKGQGEDEKTSRYLSDPIPVAQGTTATTATQDLSRTRPKAKGKQPRGAALQKITITGTRIQGAAPVGVSIQTLDKVDIQRSGYTTLDQLLQSLPADFRGGAAGATPDAVFTRGSNSGYNTTYGSGVNLLGIGNDATLVLVNGHRVAPSGSGFYTDISNIPLSAIDHIDVLTDGSSAIYGSDAIAGVVNIILKKQSQGIDASARYGGSGGFSTYEGNAEVGREWSGGGFTVDADYSGQGDLDVRDRPFTASVPSPTSVFPMTHQVWLSAAANQRLGDQITVSGDVEYSDARRLYTESYGIPAAQSLVNVPRWSGDVGATYRSSTSWTVKADVSGGEGVEQSTANEFPAGAATFEDEIREVSRFSEPSVSASGNLFSLPGGPVKLAVGASHLDQAFSHIDFNPTTANRYGASRRVDSAFGEVRIPVVNGSNPLPGLAKFTVAAAGRYDRYSDFGGTKNYKVGVSWYPVDTLQIRGAYSTSFRAPAVGEELVESDQGTTGLLLFPLLNPEGTAQIPVLFIIGASPHLKPETATNLNFGVDYGPAVVPGLKLSLTYYRVIYSAQLASAPFSPTGLSDPALAPVITRYADSAPIQALVTSGLANGATYTDATGGAFGTNALASTIYTYDLRTGNLSRTDTSGFMVSGRYDRAVGQNISETRVEATYIRDFVSQLTPASPPLSEVNTVGYPADLRITAQEAWTRGSGTVAITGHYVHGYPDTTAPTPRHVGSVTTCDLVWHYDLSHFSSALEGTAVALSGTNILNRNPPYVYEGGLTVVGVHYDAANASPVGRLISLELTRHW